MTTRLPALDGLRGLAIAMVMVGHFGRLPGTATAGVHLFFALSGFLITTLLLHEHASTGTIDLRRFYWRRALRIVPAYLLYVGVTWLATAGDRLPGDHETLLSTLTYTENYGQILRGPYGLSQDLWPFRRFMLHMWSLAVEEQFYLIWPAALLFLLPGRALRALVSILVLVGVWRVGILALVEESTLYTQRAFEATADFLAGGCLLAVVLHAREGHWRAWRWLAIGAVGLAAFLVSQAWNSAAAGFAMSASALLMAVAVAGTILRPARVLEWAPLRWLGTISYSLYLWHIWGRSVGLQVPVPFWGQMMIATIVSIGLAAISYYGMEQHILRWRDRRRSLPPAGAPAASAAA